jgi:hypothetical protein
MSLSCGILLLNQFTHRRGRLVPEVDAIAWTPFERVSQRCAKNMVKVLIKVSAHTVTRHRR